MKIKNKKATTVSTEEVIKLIIYVAGIAILFILFVSLYNMATFDKEKETAKSYLSSFKKTISEIDKEGDEAEFSLWGGEPKMVYFGEDRRLVVGEKGKEDIFFRASSDENYLCFCYEPEAKKWKCNYCVSLDYPAVFEPALTNPVFEEDTYFNIKLEGKRYVFTWESRK